jgi:hypothetical protein
MFNELAVLESIVGQDVFIQIHPDILDFTSKNSGQLVLMTKNIKITLHVPTNLKDLHEFSATIQNYLGRASLLFGWNLKNFLSFVLAKTGKLLSLPTYYDLKIMESYLGLDGTLPQNFTEAHTRLKKLVKHKSWEQLKKIYRDVYIPLVTEVIPKIETLGLIDKRTSCLSHPYYEIDGQANGRMRCSKVFKNSFNPHLLVDEDKPYLWAPKFDSTFLCFDFKHMEASVLQWLSKDPLLEQIIKSGKDIYEMIWEVITGTKSGKGCREKAKAFFLPIVFGQGVDALANSLGISTKAAETLFNKVHNKFSTALKWVDQTIDSEGYCEDYFGRKRKFEDRFYRIRNFLIQSPAATVCLHKLVKLNKIKNARICFHIHDGYGIITNKINVNQIIKAAVEILTAKEDLYPELTLRVSGYQGNTLDKLQIIGGV